MDKFFEIFEIPKVEYRTPGRTVDDEGEICEWYVERDYPSIEPVYFDLLNLYEVQYNGVPLTVNLKEYDLRKTLQDALVKLYEEQTEEIKSELKADIQEIFKDYYKNWEVE